MSWTLIVNESSFSERLLTQNWLPIAQPLEMFEREYILELIDISI